MNELLEEAVKEAYASAPTDTIVLHTLEINHQSFSEPARVCRWPVTGPDPVEFSCLLESDAPHNAGETVIFYGLPFDIQLPEKSSDTPGEFEIALAGGSALIEPYLESAAFAGGAITAIFRTFIKGREDEGPVEVWPDISLRSPKLDAGTDTITMRGSVLNWLNRKFGRLYTPSRYPALVGRA